MTKLASQKEQARRATDARWRNAVDTLRAVTVNGKADRVNMKTLLQKTWDAADVLMTALENSCQKAERDVTQKNDGKRQRRLQTASTVDARRVTTWWAQAQRCTQPSMAAGHEAAVGEMRKASDSMPEPSATRETWMECMEGTDCNEGSLRCMQRQALMHDANAPTNDVTATQRDAPKIFSAKKSAPPTDGINLPDGHDADGVPKWRWTADPRELHQQLERGAQKSSRDSAKGQGRASATTMWHQCLLHKGCTGDGTESVHHQTPRENCKQWHLHCRNCKKTRATGGARRLSQRQGLMHVKRCPCLTQHWWQGACKWAW